MVVEGLLKLAREGVTMEIVLGRRKNAYFLKEGVGFEISSDSGGWPGWAGCGKSGQRWVDEDLASDPNHWESWRGLAVKAALGGCVELLVWGDEHAGEH